MSKGLEALEIAKQRLNTIRENAKIGNRRIADELNEECIECIETCLSDIEKDLKRLKMHDIAEMPIQDKWAILQNKTIFELRDKVEAIEIIKEMFEIRIAIDETKNDKPCGMVSLVYDKDLWTIYTTYDKENIQKLKLLKEVLL